MKPLLFVVNEHDNNTVIIEKDRIENMLKLCYQQGYQDGRQTIQYTPSDYSPYPVPSQPIQITCESKRGD